MTVHWMVYSFMVAALLIPGAFFLELALRTFRLPSRWVWLGALAGSATAPVVAATLQIRSPDPASTTLVFPLEGIYEVSVASLQAALGVLPASGPFDLPFMLWMGGSTSVLALFLLGATRLHRHARSWPRVRVGGEEVLLSDGLGPAVLGFFRPLIVLPPWALTLPEEGQTLVMIHEDEHRKARDPAFLGAGFLMLTLAPWNPLLWFSFLRFRLAMEMDCDQRVLARGVSLRSYGALLLEVGAGSRHGMVLSPALSESNTTQLERRLRMMRRKVRRHPFLVGAGGFFLAAAFLVLACETPVPSAGMEEEAGPEAVAEGVDLKAEANQDGVSGSVKLRFNDSPPGVRGVGEAQPLIYIDGIRLGGEDYASAKAAMAEINPDEIERIEVLKGEAAADAYGDEAKDGVILIFMKKK